MPRYILQENLIPDAHGGPPFADLSPANILDDSSLDPSFFSWPRPSGKRPDPDQPIAARRIFWSGWMGEAPFSLDHRTWSKEAWSRLDRWCDTALPYLQRNNAIAVLRPHTRHILSDPQSCFTFLKRRAAVGGQPFELLLDPAAFLTPAMLPHAEDHLTRAMTALAHHPAVSAVLITNVDRSPSDPDLLTPSRLSHGLLPPDLIELMSSHVPASKLRITIE